MVQVRRYICRHISESAAPGQQAATPKATTTMLIVRESESGREHYLSTSESESTATSTSTSRNHLGSACTCTGEKRRLHFAGKLVAQVTPLHLGKKLTPPCVLAPKHPIDGQKGKPLKVPMLQMRSGASRSFFKDRFSRKLLVSLV